MVEGAVIEATRPATGAPDGQKQKVEWSTHESRPAPKIGVEGPKSVIRLLARLGEKTRVVGPFFRREATPLPGKPETLPSEVMKKVGWLRTHGFPVPRTFRYDEETNQYTISHLAPSEGDVLADKHKPLRACGVTLPLDQVADLKKQILDMARKAYYDGNGVYLGPDAYAIQVGRGGTARVVLSDIFAGTRKLHDYRARGVGDITEDNAIQAAGAFIEAAFK